MSKLIMNRRGLLRSSAVIGAGLAAPMVLTGRAWAQSYTNEPTGSTVTLGFNVPQTGAYADEGMDELRAYQLAVEHLNGEGDGGMLSTFSSKELTGAGINGKKVEYVTGDTQTKSDAARASATRMIERDGAIMITGGSSSGVAVAVQSLCQEMGVIFMAGLTHSNDTTGKDKKANGFRHFFDAWMSAAALAPVLEKEYGTDRQAYHLTADYTWGWTQEDQVFLHHLGDLLGALPVNIEQHVAAFGQRFVNGLEWRAIIVAEDFGPFQKFFPVAHLGKAFLADEVIVLAVGFTRARRAGCDRHGKGDVLVRSQKLARQGCLSGARGRGHNEQKPPSGNVSSLRNFTQYFAPVRASDRLLFSAQGQWRSRPCPWPLNRVYWLPD
jgi:hypothetical protein